MKSGYMGVAEASSASQIKSNSGLNSTVTPSQTIWKPQTRILAPADPPSLNPSERQSEGANQGGCIFISFSLSSQGARAGPGVDPSSSKSIPKSKH